jgi:hypothetical protein
MSSTGIEIGRSISWFAIASFQLTQPVTTAGSTTLTLLENASSLFLLICLLVPKPEFSLCPLPSFPGMSRLPSRTKLSLP